MMINQYKNPQQPSPRKSDRNILLYILIGVIAVVVVISLLFLLQKPEEKPPKTVCGNKVCEVGENCFTCALDCKCKSNEYCSPETEKCTKPVCGNGKCESFESPENCCDDCKCSIAGEVCNETNHRCESQIKLTDERVKELVTQYFQGQGMTVLSIEVTGPGEYGEKIGKFADVNVSSQDWISHMIVTEQEEVIEMMAP